MKTEAWHTIEQTYTDEFGEIDGETLAAAGQIWTHKKSWALRIVHDEQACHTLLMKACAQVTRRRADPLAAIENLSAYLLKTWKGLLLREQEKENGHRRMETEMMESPSATPDSVAEDLDRKILFQQVYKQMDQQTRRLFWYHSLGLTFPEIGEKLGQNPDVLRATFNKQVKKLKKQFASED